MRLLESIKRVNRTTRPEDDVALRVLVLAAVEVGVVATLVAGAAPTTLAVAALVLLPVGAVVSWQRRAQDNLGIKVGLTFGAVGALWWFFGQLSTAQSLDDTRAPLAGLFLIVQVLHGIDLPQRRDLGFTLASSLALVTLAATTTHAGLFGVLLAGYVALAAASLVAMQRSAARERVDVLRAVRDEEPARSRDRSAPARDRDSAEVPGRSLRSGLGVLRESASGGRAALPALLVGVLVFLLLPRTQANQLGGLPFDGIPGFELASPLVDNPGRGTRLEPPEPGAAPLAFTPDAYFGFAEYVDLRTAGELSDDPVLRIRAGYARPWRGMVFAEYDGRGWRRDVEPLPDPTYGLPVELAPQQPPATVGGVPGESRLVQTVEVLSETPNLVFGAGDPRQVWIAGRSVTRWPDGTISTSTPMEPGTVYSVVSAVEDRPAAELRTLDGPVPDEIRQRYLQLPDTVTDRTRDLAARLTADAATPYVAAERIEAWLGANVEYTLDAPPAPAAVDQVDDFLFERQQGWCEPIASSMVVLLRAAGVPARFATGFQPGDRNPISGVYDVAMSDAHAWVEVWVPRQGWVTFDPTGAVPLADTAPSGPSIPLFAIARSVLDELAGIGARLGPLPVVAVGTATVGLVLAAALVLLRRRRGRHEGPLSPIERVAEALATAGVTRDAWQTPREWRRRVGLHRPDLDPDDLDVLVADEEARRYAAPAAPSAPPPLRHAAEEAADRLVAGLAAERPSRRRVRTGV